MLSFEKQVSFAIFIYMTYYSPLSIPLIIIITTIQYLHTRLLAANITMHQIPARPHRRYYSDRISFTGTQRPES